MKKPENSYHSFKEFQKVFAKENQEKIELQNIFRNYGLDISLESIDDLEILERDNRRITYINNKTNEIITSDLIGVIYEKWQKGYSVSLTTSNQDKTFFVEHFHSITSAKNWEEAGKYALKSRNTPETKLLSRAYADVSTKYGDFCLHLEENYNDYKFGPYISVSLYYGNHDQVIIKYANDFDFNKYSLLRCKYIKLKDFNQWMMGYVDENFDRLKLNIWNYGDTESENLPIYAAEDYINTNSGAIFLDGKIKLKDSYEYIPDIFEFYKVNKELMKYENSNYSSKAYFCNYGGEYAVILKQGNEINIEFKKENRITEKWEKYFSSKILSSTDQKFSKEDFLNIITKINNSPFDSKLKQFVISNLASYLSTHDEKNFETVSSFTLKPHNFNDLLQALKQLDLVKLVEESLESLAEAFNVNIEEILGKNPPNQIKQPQYVKKIPLNNNEQ